MQGSGYGAFPGQTFIPNGGRGGGRGGHNYGGGEYYGGGGGGAPQQGGPAINPTTGQPDYSAQWAEYYRSLGMGKEAEMIEQQMVSDVNTERLDTDDDTDQHPGGGHPPAQQQAAPPVAQAAQPDYSAQWAEYYR